MKKRSAVIRIIIWSTVIILLSGIMGTVVVAKSNYNAPQELVLNVTTPNETVVVETDNTSGTPFEHAAKVTEHVNVSSAPNLDATVVATLYPGDAIQISRYELSNGKKWVFITAPVQGWIPGETVDLAPASSGTAIAATPENTYDHITPSESLREIEIEWVSGSITVEPADGDQVTVKETKVSDSKYTMICKTSGDKLFIKFCDEKLLERGFGLNFGEDLNKNLIIRVPREFQLESLEVDAAAANMTVKNMVIREVEFDGASGNCDFENCVIDQLDLDTASGDVTFTGTLQTLDCDAASASVRAMLDNVPRKIDMDSMSGDLDLTLPDNAGFTVTLDAMSSDFISDFETTVRNNNYICGDGSCRISMDAMSGDVYIRKALNAAALPVIPEATAATEATLAP